MSGDLAVELRRHEQEGSTGVLLAGDGEFRLAYGAIASAHCHRATGLDRLVVEAGVATPEDWRRAGAGDPSRVLEQPQLETLALLSVYDAAYFLLSSGAEPEFRPAPAHWLSRVCHVRPRELVRECERRGDPGSGPWPAELVDRAPVVPVRRVHRRRVVLTAGQAEVLAAADAERTVTDIAGYLGRTTYGCLTAVRELTVAGLIEPAVSEEVSARPASSEAAPRRSVPAQPPFALPPSAAPQSLSRQSASQTGAQSPASPQPGSSQPVSTRSAAPQPGSSQPGSSQPGSLQPGSPQPGSSRSVSPQSISTRAAPPRPVSVQSGRAQVHGRTAVSQRAQVVAAPVVAAPALPEEAAGEKNPRDPAPEEAKVTALAPLRQRIRRAVPVAERERWQQVDMSVLVRVRAALEELA